MLKIENLTKIFNVHSSKRHKAVDSVSFDLEPGKITALIGESGSGKTTIGKMILKLSSPTGGTIRLEDRDISRIAKKDLKNYYRRVQGVFQDPFSTFNPIFKADRVFDILLREFFPGSDTGDWEKRVNETLESVGLNPAEVRGKYAHQLSGGQLQRILIARALLLEVDVLVADEIISMLDASTRIDVLNLLGMMKEKDLSVLFITHDLSLGYYISDRVVILYKGYMVESGETKKVFKNPVHPYTRSLLQAVPRLDMKWDDVILTRPSIDVHDLFNPDFHEGVPDQFELEPGHFVARIK